MDFAAHRKLNIVVIGNGLMGRERVHAILQLQKKQFPCQCIGIYDPYAKNIEIYAKEFQLNIFRNLSEIVNANPDWVIISTPHDIAVELTDYFLKQGVRVLVEKPLGRSSQEAKQLINAQQFDYQLHIGFNYRFFDAIQQLHHDIQTNYFGTLVAINMTLGHGGKPEDASTWKLNKTQCGGGSLLDPGVHLLDLIRQFTNDTVYCKGGAVWHGFWNTGIEEEVHCILQSKQIIFNLNVSNIRWRNTFRIEVHGTDHYGIITGRNRSYGAQTYTRGTRWGWQKAESQAASEEHVSTSNNEDAFEKELAQLFFNQPHLSLNVCDAEDAYQTMVLWEHCKQQLNLE